MGQVVKTQAYSGQKDLEAGFMVIWTYLGLEGRVVNRVTD